MNRRKFLTTLLKGALATGFVGGGVALGELYGTVVNRREITVDGLPPAFEGFRIALMSDFHHSRWIPAAYIRSAVRHANKLGVDLVALTGDFVDHGAQWVPGCVNALSRLKATYGAVAVLGNHDYYDRRNKTSVVVREALARAGITELRNAGITIDRAGETLHIAGTADLWCDRPDLKKALARASQPKSVILLQHNPDFVEKIADERVGLVLSGHTHGGQCVFPIIGPPILPSKYGKKYASGLVQGPVAQVFVTTGVGSGFPPVRFCCPPEIALLTLRGRKVGGKRPDRGEADVQHAGGRIVLVGGERKGVPIASKTPHLIFPRVCSTFLSIGGALVSTWEMRQRRHAEDGSLASLIIEPKHKS